MALTCLWKWTSVLTNNNSFFCSVRSWRYFVVFVFCFQFYHFFRSENYYETVLDGSHMNTMDIRIKITDDIIKESDRFSDDSSNEEYKIVTSADKLFKSDIVNKAKNFKKKCLARISSLTVRWSCSWWWEFKREF